MEIRNRSDRRDLREALAARDRAWRVGYRGFVDEAVIDAAVTDADDGDLIALEDELESEAGKFLVAVEPADRNGEDVTDAGDGDTEADADTSDADADDDSEEDDGSDAGDESDDAAGPDVLGYARVRWGVTSPHVDTLEAEILELYVDPAHWREGVGSALLDAVPEWCPGIVEGLAISVLETNDRARSFLERRGFERDGTALETIAGEDHDVAIYRRPLRRL